MGRAAILGNGRLTVGLNEKGLVHDFYYPYVGLDNLTTARSIHHRIGVWVNGVFSWTDDEEWETQVDVSSDALISTTVVRNTRLGVEIHTQDFVDYQNDCFCRIIKVKNVGQTDTEVRLFMHQVFEISRAGRADTALFVPDDNYILDYKGRCALLISGQKSTGESFDQFAVGNYGIEGKQGTYRDAEDGELSGHAVEHGGVDSVIRFSFLLNPEQESTLDYWIAAGDSQYTCETINSIMKEGLELRLHANQMHWRGWLSIAADRLHLATAEQQELARKSLMIIKAHTDARGGVIASCDSSIYNYGRDYYSYVWPRDGAYAMWPLIRLGYTEEPKAFFDFCADIIAPEGYLMHKYQPDRAIGSTWHPLIHGYRRELAIQEDETAIIIIMIGEYLDYSHDESFVQEIYTRFVQPAANFLSGFIDDATGLPHASYDLWEEKFLTSTYTTATVYRALITASELAEKFGNESSKNMWSASAKSLLDKYEVFINPDRPGFRKGFLLQDDASLSFDNTLDASSFYGIMTYGYHPHGANDIHVAVNEIKASLLDQNNSGGMPRYENDSYFHISDQFKGNPWIVTTLWLAQYFIRISNFDEAHRLLAWVQNHTLGSGIMPEQINPENNDPVSVAPLVWSHAEYINTILDLSYKENKIKTAENPAAHTP